MIHILFYADIKSISQLILYNITKLNINILMTNFLSKHESINIYYSL